MALTKEAVLDKLKTIKGPDFERDIVSLGLVSDVFIADGKVFFSITVPADRAAGLEPLRAGGRTRRHLHPRRRRRSRGA